MSTCSRCGQPLPQVWVTHDRPEQCIAALRIRLDDAAVGLALHDEHDKMHTTLHAIQTELGEHDHERLTLIDAIRIYSRWIVSHADNGVHDHACAECVPGGDVVVPGFVCAVHRARRSLVVAGLRSVATRHLTPYLQGRAADGHCMSNSDGECDWEECPQLRDGEPHRSGRHCPRHKYVPDE